MNWFVVFVFVVSALGAFADVSRENSAEDDGCPRQPIVTISSGRIKGTYGLSRKGKKFASFRGVPYAKPPIGNLRFRPPVPVDPWNETLDATKDGAVCLQKDFILYRKPNVTGSEDCLFINVYSPSEKALCNRKVNNLLPVMVNIHWGGNIAGSSKSTILGPEFLMDKPVILVTFNYRLGVFGFLSSLTDEAPGNWAAKDQVLALRWVQENIQRFGGDKNKVTIFGTSAGAGAVHHLMLSPSTRGLFNRAISQSGCAVNLWARPFNQVHETVFKAISQSTQCDIPEASMAQVMDCLRHVDAEKFFAIEAVFKYFEREPTVIYSYVIEKKTPLNPDPFLVADPIETIQSGNFQKVPWMLGTNKDEGALKSAAYVRNDRAREKLNAEFDSLMPRNLLLEFSVPPANITDQWLKIKEFYMGSIKAKIDLNNPQTIKGFTDMYTDRAFAYGMYQAALLHSMRGHNNIWFYNFGFRGSDSYADVFADTNEHKEIDFGVSHCDELLYIFNSTELFPERQPSSTEFTMSRILISMWTDFAKYGNPNKKWSAISDLSDQDDAENPDLIFLDIKGPYDMHLRNNYRRKFMNFWTHQKVFETIAGINS